MKIYKSIIFSIFLLVFFFLKASNAFAQAEVFMGDAAGTPPLTANRYINVQGSPYFGDKDLWFDGLVKLDDGKLYKDVKLRYDQVLDRVFFRSEEGKMLAFKANVLEFKMNVLTGEVYFVSGFDPIDEANKQSFYQKLNVEKSSKADFLKRTVKKIYENRVYNSAVTDRSIESFSSYYLFLDKKLIKVKLDRKSILGAFMKYSGDLTKFADLNKINFKDENDVVKLVSYYNSLN